MSDSANAFQTGPTPSSRLLSSSRSTWAKPMLGALGLMLLLSGCSKSASVSVDEEVAMARRLQRVGSVELQAAAGGGALKSGEEAWKAQCAACHASGALGAPKFGDAAAWAPRIGAGLAALTNSALKGKNAMPAQAGGALSDVEVSRAAAYMANAGGAKFAEPKAPEGDKAP